uniref:Uncharacterized protein n=1 Tax=Panagrolaimus sp. ES5 TaxID=591445 RepID=A0AC34GHT0_9BILA
MESKNYVICCVLMLLVGSLTTINSEQIPTRESARRPRQMMTIEPWLQNPRGPRQITIEPWLQKPKESSRAVRGVASGSATKREDA